MTETGPTPPNLYGRALEAHRAGDAAQAEKLCQAALRARPGHPEALYLLAVVRQRQGHGDSALEPLDRLLKLRPDHAAAHALRGNVLKAMARFEEAVASYDRALAIRSDLADTLNNRALALQELQRFGEAMESFDWAVRLEPDHAELRFNRAYLLLLLGRFAEGWPEYEWRRRRQGWNRRTSPLPEWTGQDIAGKRVFLYAEQALGDTLQFARFVGWVKQLGAEVIFGVPPGLGALLARLDCAAAIVRPGEKLPEFDLHAPLMSLPNILGFVPGRTPSRVPYLSADPALVAHWSRRLPGDGVRVGIAWQGNPLAPDQGRHIPLGAFAPLSRVPGVALISLQKGAGLEQLAGLPAGMTVATLGAEFDAGPDLFLDTAAVMMKLDLVVTSDTAVAHLAGALGRPVWVALRHVPDWRWMLLLDDSPWYPSARLFRQTTAGDWDGVFARVAAALAGFAAEAQRRGVAE
ncbi:MAG TPA: tetratricopeptide repeat protein [Stellaceae bacterium]|nr:tetratricopeptide repeat protein [Stellaceae bacterium]